MNATLEEGRCDFVIGVPARLRPGQHHAGRTTDRRMSSSIPRARGRQIKSLDDPVLKKLKIGVHLLGDDYTNPPPVHELAKRGVVDNVVGFSTFYSAENPPSAIIDAVANGTIDVAIVWGPIAGYFAQRQRVPLELVPIPSGKGDLPFAVRHLDGRQARQRGRACEAGAGAGSAAARDRSDPAGVRRAAAATRDEETK